MKWKSEKIENILVFPFDWENRKDFRKDNSKRVGHPQRKIALQKLSQQR